MLAEIGQGILAYSLVIGGVITFILPARYYRVPENGGNKNWPGAAAIASLITWMLGCGVVLMVHFAFSNHSALYGLGVLVVSAVAMYFGSKLLWRGLKLHTMPPVVVGDMVESDEPVAQAAAGRSA